MTYLENFQAAAVETITRPWSVTASALFVAFVTYMRFVISIVVWRTFIFTDLTSFVVDTFLTDFDMETISDALLAARVTFSANCFPCERLQGTLLLPNYPLIVIAIRARFVLLQTTLLEKEKIYGI